MHETRLRKHARTLRKSSTNAETRLWYNLCANRLGYKFKRQVPLGPYIVDFACLNQFLVIELDGGQHLDNKAYDAMRTKWLNEHGFKVMRFWNNDVLLETSAVVGTILHALSLTLSRV